MNLQVKIEEEHSSDQLDQLFFVLIFTHQTENPANRQKAASEYFAGCKNQHGK